MKILMINSVCGVKSTGRICTDLAKELEKNGHEVKIAYGREKVPSEYQKYAVRIGNDLDVKIHGLQSRIFDMAGFGSKKVTQKFIEWTKKYNPDVIHLHNIHGYYINIEILFQYLKKEFKGKIIWTLHDCWAFTGHCSHFTFVKCYKWEKKCFNCPQKRQYPKSIFFDNSKRNYEMKKKLFTGIKNMKIITPSKWLASLVKKSFLGEYKVEVSYNTIDTVVFKPTLGNFRKKHSLENKKIILGVASTWNERKGIEDFFKLALKLDETYSIVLVGLNNKQLKRCKGSIIGIQKTNSKTELAEIYSAADIFFNPTYEDTYPTVNLEAEACGIDVITYHTGGAPETIHRKGSIIVEVGDLEKVLQILGGKI